MEGQPLYKIGQKIRVGNWGGETEPLEILDVKWIYHPRLYQNCWGYKMDGYTGLTMSYVPEGYLRGPVENSDSNWKDIDESLGNKLKNWDE